MYQMMITEAFTQSYCSHISGKSYLTFLCRIAQATADIPAGHGSRFIFFGVAVTVLKDINIIRIFTAKFIQRCQCAVVEVKFTGFILYLAGHKYIRLNLADKVALLFKFYIIPFQGQEKGRKQAQKAAYLPWVKREFMDGRHAQSNVTLYLDMHVEVMKSSLMAEHYYNTKHPDNMFKIH